MAFSDILRLYRSNNSGLPNSIADLGSTIQNLVLENFKLLFLPENIDAIIVTARYLY